jgi:hypothetical protein
MAKAVSCAKVSQGWTMPTQFCRASRSTTQTDCSEIKICWPALGQRLPDAALQCSTVTSQELLIQLHWPPVKYRIPYKPAILAYRSLSSNALLYLSSFISRHQPPRILRSSSEHFLSDVPRYKLSIASRGFRLPRPPYGMSCLLTLDPSIV